jgi:hypothetical protein
MAKQDNTTLLLIDNSCSNLNIKQIASILNGLEGSDFVELEGNKVQKRLIGNHLPIATSARRLKLDEFTWQSMCAYVDVALVTSKTALTKSSQ